MEDCKMNRGYVKGVVRSERKYLSFRDVAHRVGGFLSLRIY